MSNSDFIVKPGCSLKERTQETIAFTESIIPTVADEPTFFPSQGCEGLPLHVFKHNGLIYSALPRLNNRS